MSPADLLPAQIADALTLLANRDGVGIHIDTYKGDRISFQVIEVNRETFRSRSGTAPTYDAALSACRAATFSGGKDA